MINSDLEIFVDRRPFESFRIHMSDGTQFEVRHPEFVFVGEFSAIVYYPSPQARPVDYHHYKMVSLSHIVRLVPISAFEAPLQ